MDDGGVGGGFAQQTVDGRDGGVAEAGIRTTDGGCPGRVTDEQPTRLQSSW